MPQRIQLLPAPPPPPNSAQSSRHSNREESSNGFNHHNFNGFNGVAIQREQEARESWADAWLLSPVRERNADVSLRYSHKRHTQTKLYHVLYLYNFLYLHHSLYLLQHFSSPTHQHSLRRGAECSGESDWQYALAEARAGNIIL